MATVETRTRDEQETPVLKRHVGVVGLLFASVGSIIGSGWLFGALNASQQAGPAAILSWVFGAILIMLIALVLRRAGHDVPAVRRRGPLPAHGVRQLRELHERLDHLRRGGHDGPDRGRGGAAVRHQVRRLHDEAHDRRRAGPHADPARLRRRGRAAWRSSSSSTTSASAGSPASTTRSCGGSSPSSCSSSSRSSSPPSTARTSRATASRLRAGTASSPPSPPSGIVFSYLGFRQGIELAGETDNPKRNVPLAVIGSVLHHRPSSTSCCRSPSSARSTRRP